MLSYRHAFHAGGPADVLKHAVHAFVLRHATAKAKPLFLLDTHAGAGAYDLDSEQARKTGEAAQGIARLVDVAEPWPALMVPYLTLLGAWRARDEAYPGSPAIAAEFMRPTDRLELVELHPTDHDILAERFARTARVRVTREDGLGALVTRMPPIERRAVVIVDPSYEVKTDYETVVAALVKAHRRFATGTYLLWYPVLDRERTEAMMSALRWSGLPDLYRIELCTDPDGSKRGMTGSGLVIVNPPWTLPDAAREGVPWLAASLGATGPVIADWLVA